MLFLAAGATAATCESLAGLKLPDTAIAEAVPVTPAPEVTVKNSVFGPATVRKPFCRVTGTIAPRHQIRSLAASGKRLEREIPGHR